MRAPVALAIALGAVACKQPGSGGPQMPFKALVGPVIVAHRGGSLEVPENTLASLRHGVDVGADWQELDVTLTKDNKLIVIHDDTLERTTDGTGQVITKTLAELRNLHAGEPKWADYVVERLSKMGIEAPSFAGKYPDEKLPTLEEVLAIPNAQLMIEMKAHPDPKALAFATVDAVHAANMGGRVVLASFEAPLLLQANLRDSSMPLLGLAEDVKGIEAMLRLPLSVLGVSVDLAEEALRLTPQGIAVWIWTVYTPQEARRLAELGVHGLITDAPTAVLAEIRKEPKDLMVER